MLNRNNRELQKLVKQHGLTMTQLMQVTRRSRTLVYGWLCKPSSRHYRRMGDTDLRLLKLELGLEKPKFKQLIF